MIEFRKPRISTNRVSDSVGEYCVEPLERGFGYTLGNSLRRVLLSSLPGAAISSIKIEGVAHEFSTVPNVREDVTDIILNLKQLVLRLYSEEPVMIRISEKGPKDVLAKDIVTGSDVEILNKDLLIASLGKKAKLEMEMVVERGRGYVSAERNKKSSDPIGLIPVDSIFSPVKTVSYAVENTRVGQVTNFDKLILHLETNGSISADEAVSQAAKIVNDHMLLFIDRVPETASNVIFAADEAKKEKSLDAPIEELELSVRSYNCLKRKNINTLEELINCTEADLINIRNFGVKSIEEIKSKLKELDLSLREK
ncbi:MAG: DNA-directed RNA polymerase subunit alpha [Actinobacteria bacterium]|nr:DNA-directed RNA polymerase subunit alpha [Actinomycetota bacterium]